MSELARKLAIQPGSTVCLLGAPPGAADLLLAACPFDITLTEAADQTRHRLILYWPAQLDGMAEQLAALQHHILPDGAIWVVMPKKKFAPRRGVTFTWEEMQAAVLQSDLVDNKVATFSEEEYATRFVIRKDRRHLYP